MIARNQVSWASRYKVDRWQHHEAQYVAYEPCAHTHTHTHTHTKGNFAISDPCLVYRALSQGLEP